MSETGAAALDYVRRGWSVVPMHEPREDGCTCRRVDCPAAGKHPRVAWEEHIATPASEEAVRAWWARWPSANVGVVTGSVSGVVVLDVDPRNGGARSLSVLQAEWGELPHTLESATGGGGRHLWLVAPGGVPSAILAPGLELKAERSIAVAPPSLHRSGLRYEWVRGPGRDAESPAPAPSWLATLAKDGVQVHGRHAAHAAPVRTEQEQREFTEAWGRAGLVFRPGDAYYLCPFHDDHHPSLHVDAESCRWFCFGCRHGGGIGSLRKLLGEPRRPVERARRRGRVGEGGPVTVAGFEETDVIGESLRQDALLALTGGHRTFGGVELEAVAELAPDPEDPGTTLVLIEGLVVGRLLREDTERLSRVMAEARETMGLVTCRALIRGGWDRGGENVGMFGVVLFLP
jgi:hypothetical protein